jgi:hypothetical protein
LNLDCIDLTLIFIMRFKLKSIVDGLWYYSSRTFFKEFAEDQGVIQDVARNLEYFQKVTHTEKNHSQSL